MPELERQKSASYVVKRDGKQEQVQFDKIASRIERLCTGLSASIDYVELAKEVIGSLHAGITTTELDHLAVKAAANRVGNHPDYVKLASRIAVSNLHKNTKEKFSEVVSDLFIAQHKKDDGLQISAELFDVVKKHSKRLDAALNYNHDYRFSFIGLKLLEDCCLLKIDGKVAERPQQMFMRVALGIHKDDVDSALKTYSLMSENLYVHAPQTLLRCGTCKPQMSSCYSLAAQESSVDDVYETLRKSALISKSGGSVGISAQNICATSSPEDAACGISNGLIPMIRVFNSTALYINQGVYKGPGEFAMYLEPWHPDILEYLDLRKKMGQRDRELFYGVELVRCRELCYGLWIPDLLMKRVKEGGKWSLFCPAECPGLDKCFGEEFEMLYMKYEAEGLFKKQLEARKLFESVIVAQIETGMPFMIYKDSVNRKNNQAGSGIISCAGFNGAQVQYTSKDEVASCNTASIALDRFVCNNSFDYGKLHEVAKTVTVNLDKVIDCNHYPLPEVERSSKRHRAIAIGVQGLADAFVLMKYPFTSSEARSMNQRIFETIYHAALEASCELAEKYGTYETYKGSPASKGKLQYDMWGVTPTDQCDWKTLKGKIAKHGLRNSLLVSLMPSGTTAYIFGSTESFEPISSNMHQCPFCHEVQLFNPLLLDALSKLNLWDEKMRNEIVANRGSIENISRIPPQIRELFKTAWEMPQKDVIDMAADRAPFVDQSQSLNIFMQKPDLVKCTSMHFYAWEKGLKTGMNLLKAQQRVIMINSLGAYTSESN